MKYKIIKNYIDANRLMKDGFYCKGVDRNRDEKGNLVFFFDYSDELIDKLIYYSNNKIFEK